MNEELPPKAPPSPESTATTEKNVIAPLDPDTTPLHAFLASRRGNPLSADDVRGLLLPLFEQVQAAHDRGQVAPLAGMQALSVTAHRAWFRESDALTPRHATAQLERVDRPLSQAFDVTGQVKLDETAGADAIEHSSLLQPGEPIARPGFLTGWVAWEHELGHHDPLTDIFSLGMLLASASLGLELGTHEDLLEFARHWENLFRLNPQLHPVLAKLITRATEPSRRKRSQDLPALISLLDGYREQSLQDSLDLHALLKQPKPGRSPRQRVQARLRDRLFEISRRNRLLHFKPTLQSLNLTTSSVPLQVDVQNLPADALCTWGGAFERDVVEGNAIPLGRYVRFEDAPYAFGILDQIRSQDRRNRNDYGFSQLRVVLAFLHWHNLKGEKEERIHSPLLLLPVTLEKKKGVRDSWLLQPLSTEAEINPTLAHHLQTLYGLQLPATIDLRSTALQSLHALLSQAITASEPGVTLRLTEKPELKLVQARARASLERFRRRTGPTGRGLRRSGDVDYSYSRENFQPLGLQLFLRKVRPPPFPDRELVETAPTPRPVYAVAPPPGPADREKTFYTLETERPRNPYEWDLDLCNVTLANLNYRRMSLVRDYDALLAEDTASRSFDAVFSTEPKRAEEPIAPAAWPSASTHVVAADPAQTRAISRAHSQQSYVIQGPPGTGKSQTITNLIADHLRAGKRVLFVCEKRAALDVVFFRLKQHGLASLCCLIHDVQEDKKAFIAELKETYERYLQTASRLDEITQERTTLVYALEQDLETVARFCRAMGTVEPKAGIRLREIYARLVALGEGLPEISELEAETLPPYSLWTSHGHAVTAISRALQDAGAKPVFGEHPLRHLALELSASEQPLTRLQQALEGAAPLVERILSAFDGLFPGLTLRASDVEALSTAATAMAAVPASLLDPSDLSVAALRAGVVRLRAMEAAFVAAQEKTTHWKEKLSREDVPAVLAAAKGIEKHPLRWFAPSFWRVRKLLQTRYDFSKHALPPPWSQVLEALAAEYAAADERTAHRTALETQFATPDVNALAATVERLHSPQSPASVRALCARVRSGTLDPARLQAIAGLQPAAQELHQALEGAVAGWAALPLSELRGVLDGLRRHLGLVPRLLPLLGTLREAPALHLLARSRPWSPSQLEASLLLASVQRLHRAHPEAATLDGAQLGRVLERLSTGEARLRTLNAQWITEGAHAAFLERVQRSSLPASAVPPEEKEWRKHFTKGRRELEREFTKVMRHRSIRDLAADPDTRAVLSVLKPVWLMSPLSVADTLPLEQGFDVVVFDEASQIPLEEAVPAMYRAPQVIVVGDDKQLPPTDFFSAKSGAGEDEPEESQPELAGPELQAGSLLTEAAGSLPSELLAWHYRSRSESLISFSNASFYERRLLTVPDCRPLTELSPINPAVPSADTVLDRPVGFHLLPDAVYEKRTNEAEAAYIAQLVKGLLEKKTGATLGVVAFSEAQQTTIERALETLASKDAGFRELYEAELQREEDDQFCGLFVKNLENVQGDERDIVILSVCYGPDRRGKVLMNFGPINKRGGEKRLNVVFSRARRHMVVVSSMSSTAITNDYNDGASCLKGYLAYAEAMSSGRPEAARRILSARTPERSESRDSRGEDPVAHSIATTLRQEGFEAHLSVGDSGFRCDVAVRKPGEARYRLGILIDLGESDTALRVLERGVLQPGVLESFGWRVERVLTKDWQQRRGEVLERLRASLRTASEIAQA